MAQKSFYDVLLVDQDATFDEIKLAFKRRALQVHPDKGGSKEEFHLVYQALETLADPAARKKYDHGLATKTGISTGPKRNQRKRADQYTHPATSSKADMKTKPQMPGKRSTTFAGKAASKPTEATATSAEPQSKQTKLLMKIRDLLKQLPRDARNDVIINQFSQKQRVILEKWMADAAATPSSSSGTNRHSEAKALAPAVAESTPHQPGYALALPRDKLGCVADVKLTRRKVFAKVKNQGKKKACNTKVRGSGYVKKFNKGSSTSYNACICFDSLEMNARLCDLKTALEDLVILTAVKQKMRNQIGTGTFTERLQAALVSSSAEHGRNLADLKLGFVVKLNANCFIGSSLRTPSVRSLEKFGEMRSVLEPFRQYAKNLGKQNMFWLYSPVHLEDAWERFQSAVAEAWRITGVDNTAILQKICSLYDARAPLRSAGLQLWERQHMARQDKNRHRPRHLRERTPAARVECWERRRMAMQDKDKSRPKKGTSESCFARQLLDVRKLIARWGRMLKREAELVEKERQRGIKRQREEERSRRELLRKRMRSDLTMDDILGQKGARQHPDTKKSIIHILNFWESTKVLYVPSDLPNGIIF